MGYPSRQGLLPWRGTALSRKYYKPPLRGVHTHSRDAMRRREPPAPASLDGHTGRERASPHRRFTRRRDSRANRGIHGWFVDRRERAKISMYFPLRLRGAPFVSFDHQVTKP